VRRAPARPATRGPTRVRAELEAYELTSIAPAPRRRAPAFAPASGGPPLRVRAAAWYFSVTGALGLLLLAMHALLKALDVPGYAQLRTPAGGVVVALCTMLGFLLTGRYLAAGERRGALAAALTLGVPLLLRVTQAQPIGPENALVLGVGTLLVLTAWRDLR
jgi:hypothetical protein